MSRVGAGWATVHGTGVLLDGVYPGLRSCQSARHVPREPTPKHTPKHRTPTLKPEQKHEIAHFSLVLGSWNSPNNPGEMAWCKYIRRVP